MTPKTCRCAPGWLQLELEPHESRCLKCGRPPLAAVLRDELARKLRERLAGYEPGRPKTEQPASGLCWLATVRVDRTLRHPPATVRAVVVLRSSSPCLTLPAKCPHRSDMATPADSGPPREVALDAPSEPVEVTVTVLESHDRGLRIQWGSEGPDERAEVEASPDPCGAAMPSSEPRRWLNTRGAAGPEAIPQKRSDPHPASGYRWTRRTAEPPPPASAAPPRRKVVSQPPRRLDRLLGCGGRPAPKRSSSSRTTRGDPALGDDPPGPRPPSRQGAAV
jgi:hypothetical protein